MSSPGQGSGGITRVEELAYELAVRDVMTRDVLQVPPELQMAELLELFRQRRISGAPVVQQGELIGIVSLEDLIRALQRRQLEKPVSQFMTTQLIALRDDDMVVKALELFSKTKVGRLPVVNSDGRLVGILTKGDVTSGVLRALQTDFHEEEVRRYRASHLFEDIISDRTSLILRYRVQPRDFTAGGQASAHIKRALLRLGASPQIARRCAIASYEAEMNLVIHTTNGGVMRVEIQPHLIFMESVDDGPGIPDVERALQPGFSTASEYVRSLGFGAGFGLKNIERCADKMWIESKPGKGTRLEMRIYLEPDAQHRDLETIIERMAFKAE